MNDRRRTFRLPVRARVSLREEVTMSLEIVLVWLAAALIASWLVSLVAGKGLGTIGDAIVGCAGATLAGFLLPAVRLHPPMTGVAGTIVVALMGAVLALLAVRVARRS
jgi:uncharacterized membrane protein YeaQ/YmgE (transglycosylase-associated protein family)